MNLSGVITNNSSNTQAINLSLSGAYALTKIVAGTVVLSAANSFTGGTVVTAGTLQVTTSAALPDGSNLSIGGCRLTVFGAAAARLPAASPTPRSRLPRQIIRRSRSAIRRFQRLLSATEAQGGPYRHLGRHGEFRRSAGQEHTCSAALGRYLGRVPARVRSRFEFPRHWLE